MTAKLSSLIQSLHFLTFHEGLALSGRLPLLSQLNLHYSTMTESNLPRIPDSLDMERLQAMQLVAKMKESAEKHGIGFIGGFIAPNGEKFVMTNMDDDDAMALMPEDLK